MSAQVGRPILVEFYKRQLIVDRQMSKVVLFPRWAQLPAWSFNIQYFKDSIINISKNQYSMIFQYSKLQIFNISNIQYFQGGRTSRPDLPPHPSWNDQRSHSRHRFCHQPARKVGYCVLILKLILMRLLISTEAALRLPTTCDNHPIPSIPSHPSTYCCQDDLSIEYLI